MYASLTALSWLRASRCSLCVRRSGNGSRRISKTSMVNALAANITLSPTEQELFTLLKQVLVVESLQDTELRCAGGWVRDKLLGKGSVDIDIALNNLYGEQFAMHVNNYLQASEQKINKVVPLAPVISRHAPCSRRPLFAAFGKEVTSRMGNSHSHHGLTVQHTAGGSDQEQPRPVETPADCTHEGWGAGAGSGEPAERNLRRLAHT